MLCGKVIATIGLGLNLFGVIILVFKVKYKQQFDSNALGHPEPKLLYRIGWFLVVAGFILQGIGVWF